LYFQQPAKATAVLPKVLDSRRAEQSGAVKRNATVQWAFQADRSRASVNSAV